jgi:pyruvate dehydrogenase E2 component (dihydrolipoamide acetyltransferase)
MLELRLPELGENIDTATVAQVLVRSGDAVRKDQPVLEVETEKATLEVPATADGTVREVLVQPGQKIQVGATILRFEGAAAPAEAKESSKPQPPPQPQPQAQPVKAKEAAAVIEFPVATKGARPEIGRSVPAAPSVRALARELGLDILEVPGTGPQGRISRDDVKAHAKRLLASPGTRPTPGPAPVPALPDFAAWGEVETEPLSAVRRATAKAMAQAWAQVPAVTQFDHADVSQLDELRQRFNARDEARARKLTMTAIVIKIVAAALEKFPQLNSSLDLARELLVRKKYVHVGVAVDTDRGLLVPVIRDANSKGVLAIADELTRLSARARERKLTPDEMSGASFTVSNLGGLGTTYFSPIVPWPQVAILGVGRAEMKPVWSDGKFVPRRILPLSVSYDHRVIDGADAARFARWIAEALEQPLLLLVEE